MATGIVKVVGAALLILALRMEKAGVNVSGFGAVMDLAGIDAIAFFLFRVDRSITLAGLALSFIRDVGIFGDTRGRATGSAAGFLFKVLRSITPSAAAAAITPMKSIEITKSMIPDFISETSFCCYV
jgi:hypothetical protein